MVSVWIFLSLCTSFEPIFMFINKHHCALFMRFQQCIRYCFLRLSFDFSCLLGWGGSHAHAFHSSRSTIIRQRNKLDIFWMMYNNFQWISISIFLYSFSCIKCSILLLPLLHLLFVMYAVCALRVHIFSCLQKTCWILAVCSRSKQTYRRRETELVKNETEKRNENRKNGIEDPLLISLIYEMQ